MAPKIRLEKEHKALRDLVRDFITFMEGEWERDLESARMEALASKC